MGDAEKERAATVAFVQQEACRLAKEAGNCADRGDYETAMKKQAAGIICRDIAGAIERLDHHKGSSDNANS